MTKSQLHVRQICLPSLILNVRNNEKNHHYADIMIRNFHISHNAFLAPPPPPTPPQIFHNLCFSFLLGIIVVPREIENNAYAKSWGANKVHYGRSASGVRDFMARNCLANGLRAQAVGYKRIQERLLAYLIFSSKSESRTFRTISFMSTLYHALASFDRSPSRYSHRLVNWTENALI